TLESLFNKVPLLALFLTVALGYLFGKLTIGRFVLGGIAGTLIVGVIIGQLGINLDSGIKSIFFALFIYAVGYQGGPQFFNALNLKSLNQLASAFFTCLAGLFCVLAAAWFFNLDRGTAAGLAAGGLTQSAIIGTAGEAIAQLNVSAAEIKQMQTNIAVGYAVCYIFGSLGPIIMVSWFFPMVMGWDIREEAKKLASKMGGGKEELEPGEFEAIKPVVTRVYAVAEASPAMGESILENNEILKDAHIESVIRSGTKIPLDESLVLNKDDLVAVTGKISVMDNMAPYFGREVVAPADFELVEEHREIILSNSQLARKTIQQLREELNKDKPSGAYLISAMRLGHNLELLPNVELHKGDELVFIGAPKDLDAVQSKLGYKINPAPVTDFIFFGIGMGLGILLGIIQFKLFGIPVSIGTGGGCLLSGLLFGWLRSTHPRYGSLPTGASNFLRDFGLAVFVGVVGISAGPEALTTIKQYGLTLFLLGVGVTIIPQIISFYFSYYILRIKNPIEILGCITGGRSANPGFAALMQKAGNSTPVVPFALTYAVANVFLTLWGPIIVGIITVNP
ncbi:MAG: aspartate-alanine antiporter, partial [Pseudomonadota bacterium]